MIRSRERVKKKNIKKISGNLMTISSVSSAFVFIIGAFLFSIHYKLPAIVSLPFVTLGFILTFFLREPYVNGKKLGLRNSFGHLKESLVYFKNSDVVKYVSFVSLFGAMAVSIVLSLSSAYFEKILIPVSLMGVIAFVSSMIMAFSSKKAHRVDKILGERKSLFLIQIVVLIAVFSMSVMVPVYGVAFFFLISLVAGFSGVVMDDYVNRHIESSHRATMLSIKNFFNNLGVFLLFPVVGYLIKFKSMQFSFVFLGVVIFVGYFLVWVFSRKWEITFRK